MLVPFMYNVVQLLLETLKNKDVDSRIQINAMNKYNETALHTACESRSVEIVSIIA